MAKLKLEAGKSKVPFHQQVCVDDECASFGKKTGTVIDTVLGSAGGKVYKPESRGEVIKERDLTDEQAKVYKDYLRRLVKEGRTEDYGVITNNCRDFSQQEFETINDAADRWPSEDYVETEKLLRNLRSKK